MKLATVRSFAKEWCKGQEAFSCQMAGKRSRERDE